MASIAIVWVLGAILSVQGGAAFAKQLFPLIGAEATTFLRVWISAIFLLVIWRPWKEKLTRKVWGVVLVYGICLGLMNLLFYQSLARIPLGIAVALEFTGPLGVAILSSRRGLDFVWALLAAVGIFLILPTSDLSHGIDLIGAAFALGAGVCWGFYIIFAQKVGRHISGGQATALGLSIAALTILPFVWRPVTVANFSPTVLVFGFFVALLSSALPFSLEMKALRHIPSKTFGVMMSLEPAVAALVGLLFLNENLTLIQYGAIACVMLASAGSARFSR
ncbi:MAG: DMT family transporter [Bdellovibrio sp.]|nr:DMT family transporter [Bdellovibrio sp.]